VPDSVLEVYGETQLSFGPHYILPKPFDPRLIEVVPTAVADAATRTGVARNPITDLAHYAESLRGRIDQSRAFMRMVIQKAMHNPLRLVLPEGEDNTTIRAAAMMRDEGIASPTLIGDHDTIHTLAQKAGVVLDGINILDPRQERAKLESFADAWYFDRKRQGVLRENAVSTLRHNPNILGAVMVRQGFADGMISGRTTHYTDTLSPILKVLGHDGAGNHHHVYGMYVMMMEDQAYFFADCTVNVDMDAKELANLAVLTAAAAESLGCPARVAMLSFSNFGSSQHTGSRAVAEAVKILHRDHPSLEVDGEMQADTALNAAMLRRYPFSHLKSPANVLIFPTMQAGNIAYKLLDQLGGGTAIGPVLLGLPQQVHVMHTDASADDMLNIAAIAAARHKAQCHS